MLAIRKLTFIRLCVTPALTLAGRVRQSGPLALQTTYEGEDFISKPRYGQEFSSDFFLCFESGRRRLKVVAAARFLAVFLQVFVEHLLGLVSRGVAAAERVVILVWNRRGSGSIGHADNRRRLDDLS